MTKEEKCIWDTAYAEAFVSDFCSHENETQSFEQGVEHASAERAITIADLAIQRLREWRRTENEYAGKRIRLTDGRPENG